MALNFFRSRRNPCAAVEPTFWTKFTSIRAPERPQAVDNHGGNYYGLIGLENNVVRGLTIGKHKWRRKRDNIIAEGLSKLIISNECP
jgi:hypothetical protein